MKFYHRLVPALTIFLLIAAYPLYGQSWDFIKENLIDKKEGEWHWSISGEGKIDDQNDKAGFWKCPYHNSRMCLEIMTRIHDC